MKTNLYSFILATSLFLSGALFSNEAFGQCNVTFTYTTGAGGALNITSTVTGGTPPYTYMWDFGDGTSSTNANPSHTYAYNTQYAVCVQISSSVFCFDSTCSSINITNAAQNATCPGNATFTATPNGSKTDFKNTAGNWEIKDFGDGSSPQYSGSSTISHQYTLNGAFQVIAVAYSNFGGMNLACDTDTVNVTVGNIPCKADFTYYTDTSGAGSIFCQDASLGAVNRTWYLNGAVAATNTLYFQTSALAPGTYSVCLVIDGPFTCKDSTCQSIVLNYTVPCTNVTFTYSPLVTPCDAYTFNVNNTGPSLTSIDWTLNGTSVSSSLTTNITLNFSSVSSNILSQTVSCVVTRAGCVATDNFTFYNPASFYMWLDTTASTHVWYAYPYNKTSVASELWDFGDGTTSTLPFPTHLYSTPGFYNVCHNQTLTNGCTYKYCYGGYFYRMDQSYAMSYFVVVGTTGIKENSFLNDLKVFPNPASSVIHFDFAAPVKENLSLYIYNALGALVKTADISKESTSHSLNTNGLANGAYYYRIRVVATGETSFGKLYILK